MKKFFLLTFLLFIGLNNLFATHNRAGEITYVHISGYTYEVTVTTYTDIDPGVTTDNCTVTIHFGDGDSCIANRMNGLSTLGLCSGATDGEPYDVHTKKNIYKCIHSYTGPGNFAITMNNPNRNDGVCNIVNSVDTPFSLVTHLVINYFLAPNNSVVLENPPLDHACIGQCFEHNPAAADPEGDSLYYYLDTCYSNGVHINMYNWSYPPNMNASNIDHATGDLVWCVPTSICEYNIAIVIEEWQLLPGNKKRYFAGSVLRDMQIEVAACSNTQPQINDVRDTCIVAGTNLIFNVTASDPDFGFVTLSASGGPFDSTLMLPIATFPSATASGTVTGTFNWTPNCSEVQLVPYLVVFKATDSDPTTPLVNFESIFIRVVAAAPLSLTAVPSGASMILNWTAPPCASVTGANPLTGYSIYRTDSCSSWVHDPCETGVPSYTGYSLVGTTSAGVTAFIDNNGGTGLLHGINYSYIVVSNYADGSQSYASSNVCAKLVRDVPIITNVSVLTTNSTTGTIWTHWLKPIGNAANLDTIANPGPYEYRLMKAPGITPAASAFIVESSYTYSAFWQCTDTGFVSTGTNTQTSAWTYRVDFYSNGNFIGSTHTASSVFLTSTPAGNSAVLNWTENVPWINSKYTIYRDISGTYTQVGITMIPSFTDTGLVNGTTYCYKILTEGQYSDTTLPHPLFNWSEIKCETPVDIVPPCQPNFNVATDCGIYQNVLSWTNPNTYCSNDAVQYNVYFSPTTDGDLHLIYSTTDMNNITFTHIDNVTYPGTLSIAGCYAVTAIDNAVIPNESPIINKTCVDNCPEYELPNVFTPNNDGKNDFFIPLPYRYVKDIDIKIYDRWGLLMFESTDPDINWDGTNYDNKEQCPDGVYFYVCIVNEIHVDGIHPRALKGFIQLINTKSPPIH